MTPVDVLAWGGLALLVGFALLAALRRPLAIMLRLALRSAAALAALSLLAPAARLAGIHLGANLFNALVLGLLGVPGFGLLLMLQWAVR